MTLHSPLLPGLLARGGSTLPYADPGDPTRFAQVIDTFGALELEYAALRKACALFDRPQRGTILVRGAERIDFLNRMITQELKDLLPFASRHAFWLNRRGRIDADVRVTAIDDHLRFDLDAHAVRRTIETLQSYLFAEEVELVDASESLHRLALHGPEAAALLSGASVQSAGPGLAELADRRACVVRVGADEVLVERDDACGEVGLELTCAAEAAARVCDALLGAGATPEGSGSGGPAAAKDEPGRRTRLRPAGWHAFNIARIEAGTPLYNLDFGPDNLPHETGVLRDRVSFKKGCYLGQEIVARTESLGHPKQKLVALRFEDDANPELPQPVSGAEIFAPGEGARACGHVTSSTISPMLGAVPVCFAMVKFAHATPGTRLLVTAEDARIGAVVQPELAFYRR
jgi:folate-binding protein YgfZ